MKSPVKQLALLSKHSLNFLNFLNINERFEFLAELLILPYSKALKQFAPSAQQIRMLCISLQLLNAVCGFISPQHD